MTECEQREACVLRPGVLLDALAQVDAELGHLDSRSRSAEAMQSLAEESLPASCHREVSSDETRVVVHTRGTGLVCNRVEFRGSPNSRNRVGIEDYERTNRLTFNLTSALLHCQSPTSLGHSGRGPAGWEVLGEGSSLLLCS